MSFYFRLHYVALLCAALCHVALRYIAFLNVKLCYVTLSYVTLCYVTLSIVTLCYITLGYVTVCYVTLFYVTLCYVRLCYYTLCYILSHFVVFPLVGLYHVKLREVELDHFNCYIRFSWCPAHNAKISPSPWKRMCIQSRALVSCLWSFLTYWPGSSRCNWAAVLRATDFCFISWRKKAHISDVTPQLLTAKWCDEKFRVQEWNLSWLINDDDTQRRKSLMIWLSVWDCWSSSHRY